MSLENNSDREDLTNIKVGVAVIQERLDEHGKKVDGINQRLDILNGRTARLEQEKINYAVKIDLENLKNKLNDQNSQIKTEDAKTRREWIKTVVTAIGLFLAAWAGTGFKTPWG